MSEIYVYCIVDMECVTAAMRHERRNGFKVTFITGKEVEEQRQRNCSKESMVNHHLEVCLDVDTSLKGWTDNCLYRCKRVSSQEKRNFHGSVYCEVLGNGTCTGCTKCTKTLSSINSSLAEYPDLNTGGYLLFLTLNEKLQKNTKNSAVPWDSGFSSQRIRSSPGIAENPHSRRRVRTASVLASELRRLSIETPEKSPRASATLWRPSSSETTNFDTNSPSGQRVSSCRMSMRNISTPRRRPISVLSQEGWSVKQIEAWKLLAPTPPQIEVSQMNVSMYTPKELPGIKIFDESFFVI